MGKVKSRFIELMIFGICSSGSARLTEIGRSLNEQIKLKATHKRLDRNLDDPQLQSQLTTMLLRLSAGQVGGERITPLDARLWSQKAAGFESENNEVLYVVRQALTATNKRGIIVYDRGGDRGMLYKMWAADPEIRFLIRQVGNRDLVGRKNQAGDIGYARDGSVAKNIRCAGF